MASAAQTVAERSGTIRLVAWGGLTSLVAAVVAVFVWGLVAAGPYAGVGDPVAFLAFEAAVVVGTLAFVLVSVLSA